MRRELSMAVTAFVLAGTPRAEVLTEIGPMREARAAHTATALADGTVLVVGGFTGDRSSRTSAELFDPTTDRFVGLASPTTPRHSHTATLLADGRVLIAGGYTADNVYSNVAELYDPRTRTFTPTGRLTTTRAGHQAVLLRDGRVLLVGGVGTGWTFLSSAELFDPRTGRFSATGSMSEARESHIAVRVPSGDVLVVAGHRGRRSEMVISRTVERYDVAAGRFVAAGELQVKRHKHDAVAMSDGTVLVLAGSDERDDRGVYTSVERFDPRNGRSALQPALRLGRYKHQGTTIVRDDGTLLLLGGASQGEHYDPRSASNALVNGATALAGQFSAVAPLPGGRALLTGGYGGGTGARASAWVYTP